MEYQGNRAHDILLGTVVGGPLPRSKLLVVVQVELFHSRKRLLRSYVARSWALRTGRYYRFRKKKEIMSTIRAYFLFFVVHGTGSYVRYLVLSGSCSMLRPSHIERARAGRSLAG